MGKTARVATIVLLSFLFAVSIYRAATQSFTHDEALTYLAYINAPFSYIFTVNNPNNHLLATILMRLSAAVLGASEFSLRLPSLACGALYFVVIYRLCLLLFGEGLLLFVSAALLGANPFLLDFLVAARGYGPAVAFFFAALYCLVLYVGKRRYDYKLLYLAAAGLSFAVMSNMTLFFPAAVLAAIFLATLPAPAKAAKARKGGSKKIRAFPDRSSEARRFVLPVIAFAIVFWVANPVNTKSPGGLYRTNASIGESLEGIVRTGFAYQEGPGPVEPPGGTRAVWVRLLARFLLPSAVVAGFLAALRMKSRSPAETTLLWASGVILGSMALHLLGRPLFRVPYPADRTGIQYLPLAGLVLVTLAGVLRERPGVQQRTAFVLTAFAAILGVQYLIQFDYDHFYVWPYDADNKQILQRLKAEAAPSKTPLRVGISWQLQPSLEFYRETRDWKWLPQFHRVGPKGDYDYYVLLRQDRALTDEIGAKVLYVGPISGTVLASK